MVILIIDWLLKVIYQVNIPKINTTQKWFMCIFWSKVSSFTDRKGIFAAVVTR